MVLICGDSRKLPWEQGQNNILKFFIQCKRMKKPIFISGIGMGLIAYYCAVGYNSLKFINPKGGQISALTSITSKELTNIDTNDLFLNSATGDYYSYSKVNVIYNTRKKTNGSLRAILDYTTDK